MAQRKILCISHEHLGELQVTQRIHYSKDF